MMGRKVSAAGKRMPEEIRPARLPLMKQGASHAGSFFTEVGGVGLMRPPLGGRKLQNAACHLAIAILKKHLLFASLPRQVEN